MSASAPTPFVVVEQTVNDDLVEFLEKLLAEAKSGELQHIVCATGWAGGFASYSWRVGAKNRIYTLLGALYTCAHELTSKAVD